MQNDVPQIFQRFIEFLLAAILFLEKKIYVWFHEYLNLYDKVCYVSHTVIKSLKSKLTIIIIS